MSGRRPLHPGTADPLDFPFHRALGGASDTLRAGAALVNATPVYCVMKIAGSYVARIRGLFTAGGTIKFYYLRPGSDRDGDGTADCYDPAVGAPRADKVVVADTEFVADVLPSGESELLLKFTPSAGGAVTFLDGMNQ